MVKHTEKIRRQPIDELFECVWPFCGVGAKRVKKLITNTFACYPEVFCKKVHTCFPVKFAKFLRTPILKNI